MKMTKGAVGKGTGHYSRSHPSLTKVHNDKGTKSSMAPRPTDVDNSYSGPGMSAPLPKKGK